MKITVTKAEQTKPQPTDEMIVARLNRIINVTTNSNYDFFWLNCGEIKAGSCANLDAHNKLISIIDLWCCINSTEVYTPYICHVNDGIKLKLGQHSKFYDFLCSLPDDLRKLDEITFVFNV